MPAPGGGEELHEEVGGGDGAGPVGTRHLHRALGGQHRRRVVGGGIGVGQAAADGAGVAHLHVADDGGGLGQQGRAAGDGAGGLHVAVGGAGADDDVAPLGADLAQLLDPADVDQMLGRRQAQLHGRQQAVAPGEQAGVVAVLLQQAHRLVEGGGTMVLEARRNHLSLLLSCRWRTGWPATPAAV